VQRLLAAEKPFALTAEQDARLETILDETLRDQAARL
jgi:hypothetical protein